MSKTHSILMLVENLSVPADPRVWREAQTLRRCGFTVSVICPMGEQRDREPYVCIQGVHIYRYKPSTSIHGISGYLQEFTVAMLKTLILSFKVWSCHGFDAIHAANPPDTFFVIGLFYRFLGKKYIFDQHDLSPEVFHVRFKNRIQPLYRFLKFLEWCSYKTADLVITTNESQKRMAITRGHVATNNIFIVRNGPELSRYKLVTPNADMKRGRKYLLAYIGVMGAQDGVEYAIHAVHELVRKRGRQDVSLVLMGSGDQLVPLQTLTKKLALEDYIHFTGWVEKAEMLSYLSAADIGLSPDPSNELNDQCTMIKTLEYMAMGKPVVAFDLPETRISAGESALYATGNSVEEFVNHIETLLEDENLRLTMGANGRHRIEEEFSWDRTKVKLWRAYEKLFGLEIIPPSINNGNEQIPQHGINTDTGSMSAVTI